MMTPSPSLPPASRRPEVARILKAAAIRHGVELHNIVGRNRRRVTAAVAARREAVLCLYGTATLTGRVYGLSETARVLGIHHATVLYHVRKAGRT